MFAKMGVIIRMGSGKVICQVKDFQVAMDKMYYLCVYPGRLACSNLTKSTLGGVIALQPISFSEFS